MINILNHSIKKFTHIIHVADIHIRLNKRHDEYKEVFQLLYEQIKQSPETTVVALLGDIFHSKSDLSPECVQMAADLFKNIADLRPLILIAGNHDATLSNKSRLDSLTPVVDAVNHPNLYYLKTTGLYGFGNILFNNMGVFDPPEKYIKGEDIPAIYKNQYDHIIALFHGAVDNASLDSGYSISNPSIMNPLFDNHHIALLGDIHKMQDMQEYSPDENKPCIRYAGSLIQQNHGEGLKGHGYSLWNLSDHSYTHHEIENDFGYVTIEINKGHLTSDISNLPNKVRLRIKCYESIASEVKSVISKVKELTQVIEVVHMRMDKVQEKKDVISICTDIILTDLTNIDYQNRIISEFLNKKLLITEQSTIDSILSINRHTNTLIKHDEFARNLKWKPIRFEFDNMFTYGENNVLDFTQMNGIYGIFGPNRCGKSSILSAIIFCLFDKFDRGFKGVHVLNVQKTSFKCKLEFEIAGVRYFIERKGSLSAKSGNVKVDVKFWKVVDGIEEELHGTARRDTNDIIRDYIGTYEDFILTSASFQNAKNNSSFIDIGNSERKDLLVQFIGLNIFDKLYESAGDRNKELNSLLKLHKDKNYTEEIKNTKISLDNSISEHSDINKEVESLIKLSSDVNEQIIAESSNLIKLDNNVPTNLPALELRKKTSETSYKEYNTKLEGLQKLLSEKEGLVSRVRESISKIESSNLVESHKTYKILNDKIIDVEQKIDIKKVQVKGKIEKVERLDKHQYDPNCKYCNNNSFVQDATKAKSELENDKIEADKLLSELSNLKCDFEKYKWVEESYSFYTKFLSEYGKLKDECASLNNNIIIITNALEKVESSINIENTNIELYHRNRISVEENEKINTKISNYRNNLTHLDIEFRKQNRLLMDISVKIELLKNKINDLTVTIEEVTNLENESNSYKSYLESIGRDGVPYQIICNTVPEIEREVNSILNQVVDYTIQFETDGKNIIPYVVYDYGRWPIELTSGFERFVASLAIRVALTEISNLPKCNNLQIDEGFGTLDPDNLASMHTLFSLLKNYFDFVIVISHLEALKDSVDKTIEITQEGNFSKVIFE